MEGRLFRIGALVEWVAAAAGVLLTLWVVSGPVQRVFGHGVQAAAPESDVAQTTPPGVPAGATLVPVMLLMDGREVRQGDLHAKLDSLVSPKLADGPPVVSSAQFGERQTRAYKINGTTIYIVCERAEPDGQMKVAGIYVP